MNERRLRIVLPLSCALLFIAGCPKKNEDKGTPAPSTSPSGTTAPVSTPAATAAASAATPTGVASGAAPAAVQTPPGAPPADGKYERVTVDGVTVPMIQVMNSGAVVLVDTDGKKPRTWEEQYKRKRELPNGQYDVHKTDTNKNDKFDDDTIDKEGLWVIDAKGNITKH